MQCFIPFSEELLEQVPDFRQMRLVPFDDQQIDYVMGYEVCKDSSEGQWNTVDLSQLNKQQLGDM